MKEQLHKQEKKLQEQEEKLQEQEEKLQEQGEEIKRLKYDLKYKEHVNSLQRGHIDNLAKNKARFVRRLNIQSNNIAILERNSSEQGVYLSLQKMDLKSKLESNIRMNKNIYMSFQNYIATRNTFSQIYSSIQPCTQNCDKSRL
eukprot:TRINITY_DN22561_c0_g1_i3.p2 TRINITY_DN22561_c0_g1~~TRINITY_DN22561_c0_g1_i3.p2  ORF type:complete len:144 (+),score=28.46 TRINITY_DN22561_c0_g1_i3:798-1229(+)